MRWWVRGIALAVIATVAVTVWVEWPARPLRETLHESDGASARMRALVLYHPSRDAGFSDALSLAVADGIADAGMNVERATLTDDAASLANGAALVVVVSNTFWFQPDWPTRQFLKRANWAGRPVLALIGGAGSTARAARLLREDLSATGAQVIDVAQFWRARPNDETRRNMDNVAVAAGKARALGEATARAILERTA